MSADTPPIPAPRVLACVKQVRLPESPFELHGGRAVWTGAEMTQMGRCDEFALEEALCLKDARPGTAVTALTLGPPSAQAVLRRALGMGADGAMHLATEDDSLRPGQVAAAIAAWAGPRAFDLILCGMISEDAMAGQIGPMLAAWLDLPCVSGVAALELDPAGGLARVEREMEGGRRQALEVTLPALLTIQSSRRAPRYPTLSGLLKAKKAELPSLDAAGLDLPPAREEVLGLRPPGRLRAGLRLEGGLEAEAAQLLAILRQRALL